MSSKKLTLEGALEWAHHKFLEGHKSDGCTMAPDLGIKRFCYMHDFLIRFKAVTRARADNLFFQGIWSKGWRYYPVAILYWLFVRAQGLSGLQPGGFAAALAFTAMVSFMAYGAFIN